MTPQNKVAPGNENHNSILQYVFVAIDAKIYRLAVATPQRNERDLNEEFVVP